MNHDFVTKKVIKNQRQYVILQREIISKRLCQIYLFRIVIDCVFWKALVCSLWQPQIIVQIRSLWTFSNPRLPTSMKTPKYFNEHTVFFYSWLPVRFEYTESCTCRLKVIIRVGLIIWNSLLSSVPFFPFLYGYEHIVSLTGSLSYWYLSWSHLLKYIFIIFSSCYSLWCKTHSVHYL